MGRNFCPLPLQRGIWASCAAHVLACLLLSQPFRQSCTSKLCHCGCATQNWGRDTCKVLEGVLKSKYATARRIFLVPQLISFWEPLQGKSKQVQKAPCRPKPQQTSSAERILPAQPPSDSTSRGTQRQGQTQKHQFPCIESLRKQSSPQPCPEPFPQRRRMRQCKAMSNTAPRASCSQGYHGPCAARRNPQRYLFRLLGYPHPLLRERALPYYSRSEGDGTSGNHSQRIRHRQLLGTGMVSPTYAYAAPSSYQVAVGNYCNTRDKRIHA